MAKALALAAGVLAAALLATLTGCFGGAAAFNCSTNEDCDARGIGTCQPNRLCSYADSMCSSGERYGSNSGDLSDVCVGQEPGPDGDTRVCFGAPDGFVRPCFPSKPTGDITLVPPINTDDPMMCASDVTDAEGFCVIAGERILVNMSVTATGSKPLVLVANSRIEISARLDVASHRSAGQDPPYSTTQRGAGSDPAACSTGASPTDGGAQGGGGGGAGGTFGGAGGSGGDAPGAIGGKPGTPQAPTTLRGGCPGQNGIGGPGGLGGHGGGAVYLIASAEILVSSAINASGEGGHPGLSGAAGGGGGGSGGMIGLDAPMIMNMGLIFANGGSGGEGSTDNSRGDPGPEPTNAAPSAAPLGNTAAGGDGGGGGAGGTAGGTADGGNGMAGVAAGTDDGGGGGGGGGAGVIKVFRGTMIMGSGQVSPNPS